MEILKSFILLQWMEVIFMQEELLLLWVVEQAPIVSLNGMVAVGQLWGVV